MTGQRLSELLRELDRAGGDRPLGDILAAIGERGFGAAMLLLAAPNVIPTPPGTSAVFGAPLLFITAQLMLGHQVIWLPARLKAYVVSERALRGLTAKIVPYLEKAERLLKPRGTLLVSPAGERLAGLACFILSIILFLPIPLVNMAPAWALCFFALGIIERDATAMAIGWFGAAATGTLLYLIADALWAAVNAFTRTLFGF